MGGLQVTPGEEHSTALSAFSADDDPAGVESRHIAEAMQYASAVVAGEIAACKWVRAACRRQLDDLDRWRTDPTYPFDWRPELGDRVIRFVELLPHVEGKWAGQPLLLEAWQKFQLACVFSWVRKSDGLRRFRTWYLEVPRKNAKTTLLAAVLLYMLVADGEFGAQVYSAATSRDQARIVFRTAREMAARSPKFRARFGVECLTHSVVCKDLNAALRPLAAQGQKLDGLNVHCAGIDELHAHKTREVHDVIDSATGARTQPLIAKITTAGSNRAGVCYDQRGYLCKLLNAVLMRHGGMGYRVEGESAEDDSFFGVIYTIDDGDDEFDERVWIKANPNYGVSVNPVDMHQMATVARVQAAALNEFRAKRLNIWINADSAWMNMAQWDACRRARDDAQLAGAECWIGLDAAFKKDLFAKMRVFRIGDRVVVRGRYYMPQAQVEKKGNEQLQGWVREGWIRTTPGEVLDIEAVREELLDDMRRYDVVEIGFDPAQITQFAGEMLDQGVPMVEVRPLVVLFSPAMKELEELVVGGRLEHNGDPVLAWAISNVVCHRDAKDNIYPRKERVEQKIDPAIALIIAIARSMAKAKEQQPEPAIIVL